MTGFRLACCLTLLAVGLAALSGGAAATTPRVHDPPPYSIKGSLVSFEVPVNLNYSSGPKAGDRTFITVDWGDGSHKTQITAVVPAHAIALLLQRVAHRYASSGWQKITVTERLSGNTYSDCGCSTSVTVWRVFLSAASVPPVKSKVPPVKSPAPPVKRTAKKVRIEVRRLNGDSAKLTKKAGNVFGLPVALNCDKATCTAMVKKGTKLTLYARAAKYWKWQEWSGGWCSGDNPFCTLTMKGNRSIDAKFMRQPAFEAVPYPLTWMATGWTDPTVIGMAEGEKRCVGTRQCLVVYSPLVTEGLYETGALPEVGKLTPAGWDVACFAVALIAAARSGSAEGFTGQPGACDAIGEIAAGSKKRAAKRRIRQAANVGGCLVVEMEGDRVLGFQVGYPKNSKSGASLACQRGLKKKW
jgi:hypothetical protein